MTDASVLVMNDLVIDRAPVESSCIVSIGYAEAAKTLEVEFHSGAVYRYFGVLPEIHVALMEAASKGAYLNRYIKGRHAVILRKDFQAPAGNGQ